VVAGTNGAGKSSIAGAALARHGATCYDPDRATRRYVRAGLALEEANARAWQRGRAQLERSLAEGTHYAFETTLGGRTITRLLIQAGERGHRIRVWYVGLASPELHLRRVRARVAGGGHEIPERTIRARWTSSRQNLVRLLPHLSELVLYDNSYEAAPAEGRAPRPLRILHARSGEIVHLLAPEQIPAWCRPVVAAAVQRWGGDS